jgi:cystathionine gamma-synthase
MDRDHLQNWTFDTLLVHEGEAQERDRVRPTATPIYATATFLHPSAAELDRAFDDDGLVYSRYTNPTVASFERAMAAVEGGAGAVAFASGMAALHVALLAASTADGARQPTPTSILAAQDLYGATRSLLQFLSAQGWSVRYCDMSDRDQVAASIAQHPAVVLFEPLSNPLLKVCDVPYIVTLAHDRGARVVVDNTLASPVLLRPLVHGSDFVVHSATKYLGGHGDVLGGVVTARTSAQNDALRRYAKLLGPTLGPHEAHLLGRGLKTLALRVRQQSRNAAAVAEWLCLQGQVARVYYPGLPDHPHHDLATELFGGLYGGMVAFDLRKADQGSAFGFMDALRLVLPATTLGDVFSLVSYSARSSHRDLPPDERRAHGIGDGLLRLSIGIEDPADIIADLRQALAAAG